MLLRHRRYTWDIQYCEKSFSTVNLSILSSVVRCLSCSDRVSLPYCLDFNLCRTVTVGLAAVPTSNNMILLRWIFAPLASHFKNNSKDICSSVTINFYLYDLFVAELITSHRTRGLFPYLQGSTLIPIQT